MNEIAPQVAREPEIQREVNNLKDQSAQLRKISEELITRLASVLTPNKPDGMVKETATSVATPLATNLREVSNNLDRAKDALHFILNGLEI